MKKVLAVLLAAGLLLLTSCSGKDQAGGGSSSAVAASSGPSVGSDTEGSSSAVSDQQVPSDEKDAIASIPGFKTGVFFGMTKDELMAVEPELVRAEGEEEEIWCSFETVSGTPVYELASAISIDLTNCYTFTNGKLASVEAYTESSKVTVDDYLELIDAYDKIYGVMDRTSTDEIEGITYNTSIIENDKAKLTLSFISNIPDQEDYLSLIFEPVA